MNLGVALGALLQAERDLADEYRRVAEAHAADHDVHHLCTALAGQCDGHAEKLRPHAEGAGAGFELPRPPRGDAPEALALLHDLRRLFLAAEGCSITWVMVGQAAQAARDDDLLELVRECHEETELQVKWLVTRIKEAAPQALVTA